MMPHCYLFGEEFVYSLHRGSAPDRMSVPNASSKIDQRQGHGQVKPRPEDESRYLHATEPTERV